MLRYQDFAILLSGLVLLQYTALLVIALRRSHFRDRRRRPRTESVAAHARFIEGPVITVLLLCAVGVFLAAVVIGSPNYTLVAGLVVASIRGGLFCLGLWLLAFYWYQRPTWR